MERLKNNYAHAIPTKSDIKVEMGDKTHSMKHAKQILDLVHYLHQERTQCNSSSTGNSKDETAMKIREQYGMELGSYMETFSRKICAKSYKVIIRTITGNYY